MVGHRGLHARSAGTGPAKTGPQEAVVAPEPSSICTHRGHVLCGRRGKGLGSEVMAAHPADPAWRRPLLCCFAPERAHTPGHDHEFAGRARDAVGRDEWQRGAVNRDARRGACGRKGGRRLPSTSLCSREKTPPTLNRHGGSADDWRLGCHGQPGLNGALGAKKSRVGYPSHYQDTQFQSRSRREGSPQSASLRSPAGVVSRAPSRCPPGPF